MLKKIIKRPVLATVISALLVILGVITLRELPIEQFPAIAPPCVVVKAVYPGANAETIIKSVAPSLEDAINGVEDMIYMSSTASNDGTLAINIFFKLGTNPDQASVNVQNRISQAMSQLPQEVIQQGITTSKQQLSNIMAIGLYTLDEKKYDEVFLDNYASINILPEMRRIPGVGLAFILGGGKDYSMRVWLNPAQMKVYNVTPDEVSRAIQDKNLEAAPGKFGDRTDEAFEYVIKYKGKLNTPEDYKNIAIRTNNDGSVLRLKDVARVELGSYQYSTKNRLDGRVSVNMIVVQSAGSNSNANEIQIEVNKLLEKAKKKFPTEVDYSVFYSTKRFLDASIEQVIHTLIEAFILVFLVVYLFLQDIRSTLIPAIAVPVAIIGTFFFMGLFGFTINFLTLFALVLSIGIVVDDAIVVVEAVHSKMHRRKLSAHLATTEAMHEITGAIVSITLIMAAVFLPVGLMKGATGLFYRQFAFTMAIAIVISAVNALTLSPALAALFLKDPESDHALDNKPRGFKERFFAAFNASFNSITNKYIKLTIFLLTRKWIAVVGLLAIIISTVYLIKKTPTGFIPAEDQSFLAIAANMPSATSLKRTQEIMVEAENKIRPLEATRALASAGGFNVLTNTGSPSAGIMFWQIKDKNERGTVKNIEDVQKLVQDTLAKIKGANFFVFGFPTVPGFSQLEALEVVLQDKNNGKADNFSNVASAFIAELNKHPAIGMAFTTYKADYPQYEINIDNDKAGQLGVSVKDVLSTIQSYYGTSQATDFNRFGKYYRVVLQAEAQEKRDPSTLSNVYVKNNRGEMVPINTLVSLTRVFGSETASRYNLFNSIQLNVLPKQGHSSGEAIAAIKELAEKKLPTGFTYEFSGQTREEIASGDQSTWVFILCLVFVYFLLAAQYESYILPLSVILSIPTGILGVFLAIGFKGIENNIYVQVALVMLIGLLAKNAILIVEFSVQRRRAGKSLAASAIEGAKTRLRPIVMTSLAFVFGLFPMSIATGPSAQGNHSISFAAAGGMVSGVLLGVIITPILFVIFQALQEKIRSRKITPTAITNQ